VLALLVPASPAFAHAFLIASTPASGADVKGAPDELRLVFSEGVVQHFARVIVIDAHGRQLQRPPVVTGQVVTVALLRQPVGSYTVRWRMVASDDGHVTEGAYSFGVRAEPLPPAPVHGAGVPVAPQLLAWLQFIGVVLVGGVLTFRALVVRRRWQVADHRPPREARVAMGLAAAGAIVALHAGVLAFLAGVYPIVGGGLSGLVNTEIEPLRAGTHLGQAWTLMTFAWLGVLALIVAAWTNPRRREPLLAAAGVAGLVIVFGISWASHPASRGSLALIADYVHLVAAALWVGGVLAIAITAAAARSSSGSAREEVVRASIVQFSKLAVVTVGFVGLGGVYLAIRELPSPSALLSSGYGITLLVKSLIVVGALTLGAYHRRLVVPRIAAGTPTAIIRKTLALEAGLLLLVLAAAAILSQTAPPG
jgi:copper transport protein